ncbi:MAG: glycosyltransferase family 4 protein, partial [candidate division Zixibacteria bacterium]|nr:glycosyltransferase family 4 protein [candidate division Zixibacteria bacterium]
GVKIYRFRYAEDENDQNLAYRGQMHKLVLGSISGIFKFQSFLNHFRKAAFEIIEKEKINAVAGHWLIPSGLIMKSIQAKYKLPMVMSSHGTDIRLLNKYSGMAYKYLKPFCYSLKSWTVVSNFMKEELLKTDKNLYKNLKVLPLPHDESIFYYDESVKKDENLITSVTRFTEQKRVDILIKAFALVVEKNDRAKLHIYGEGDLQGEIEQLIEKFGLQSRITIFAPVPQIQLRNVYNKAATVVLNSYKEGFGLVLSEAMMCKTSVVGTKSGGITDIIKDNETGLLCELDNMSDLANKLNLLLSDKSLRNKLASNGHKFAHENYASYALSQKYAELVKRAIEKRKLNS